MPLVLLPLMGTPFEQVGDDIIRSLEPSTSRCHLIEVLVDYVIQYPKVVEIHNTSAQTAFMELLKIFLRMGLLQEILTNQGIVFMS